MLAGYVAAKVAAGADVIQLFDSWVGTLSPTLYRDRVAPWSAAILAAVLLVLAWRAIAGNRVRS